MPTARVIGLACAVTVVAVLPSFLAGALAVQIRAELGFGQDALGLALGLFLGVGSLASTFTGRMADRRGPLPGMRAAALLAAASLLGIAALARSFAALAVGLVVGGLANAVGQPSANLYLASYVRLRRQGLAFGLRQSAAPASSLLGGLAVPLLGVTVGWRWAFVVAAGLGLVTAAYVPRRLPEAPPLPPSAPGAGRSNLGPLAVLAVAGGLGFAAASALTYFLVDAAVAAGFAEGTAGLLLSLGSVIAVATRIGMGLRADLRESGHLLVVTAMLAVGALTLLLLATGSKPLMVLATVTGFCTAWGWSGLFFYAVVRHNREATGRATGIVQSGAFFGGIAGPLIFGWVVARWDYAAGWVVAACWCALAAAVTWLGRALDRRTRAAALAAAPS